MDNFVKSTTANMLNFFRQSASPLAKLRSVRNNVFIVAKRHFQQASGIRKSVANFDFAEAKRSFDRGEKNTHSVTAMMSAYNSQNQPHLAQELFSYAQKLWDHSVRPDIAMYTALMVSYRLQKDLKQVEEIAQKVRDNKITMDDSFYDVYFYAFFLAHDFEKIESIFAQIPHDNQTPAIFGTVMDGYAANDMFDKVEQLFHTMQERKLEMSGMHYSAFIRALAATNRFEQAVKIFEEMKTQAIQLKGALWHGMIETNVKMGNLKQAVKLLQEAINIYNITSFSVSVFNSILNACIDNDMHAEFGRVWQLLLNSSAKPDSVSFMTMMKKYTKEQNYEAVISMYARMENDGIISTSGEVAFLYLLKSLANTNLEQMEAAIAKYRRALNLRHYSTIILAFCNSYSMEKALHYFNLLIEQGLKPNDYIFTVLINGYFRNNNLQMAEQTYYEMTQKYDFGASIKCSNCMIKAYCRTLDCEKALQIFNGMEQIDTYTLSTMMQGFMLANKSHLAIQLYKDNKHRITLVTEHCHTILIKAYIALRQLPEAEAIYNELLQSNLKISYYSFSTMMVTYVKANRIEDAERVFATALEVFGKANEYLCNILLDAYIKHSKLEEGKKLVQYIYDWKIPLNKLLTGNIEKFTSISGSQ